MWRLFAMCKLQSKTVFNITNVTIQTVTDQKLLSLQVIKGRILFKNSNS